MTATYAFDDKPADGHALRPGASPASIRAHLLPEDQIGFDDAYAGALADAREQLDLIGLFRTLEHWRRLAVIQSDPDAFRHTVRRAAEVVTGRPSPEDEPLAVTRSKAGM